MPPRSRRRRRRRARRRRSLRRSSVSMHLDWERLFKRYVIDDVKTPYMVAADRLSRTQARYELFVYVLFIAVLFGVIGVASISTELPHQGALSVPVYALSVVWAAI